MMFFSTKFDLVFAGSVSIDASLQPNVCVVVVGFFSACQTFTFLAPAAERVCELVVVTVGPASRD